MVFWGVKKTQPWCNHLWIPAQLGLQSSRNFFSTGYHSFRKGDSTQSADQGPPLSFPLLSPFPPSFLSPLFLSFFLFTYYVAIIQSLLTYNTLQRLYWPPNHRDPTVSASFYWDERSPPHLVCSPLLYCERPAQPSTFLAIKRFRYNTTTQLHLSWIYGNYFQDPRSLEISTTQNCPSSSFTEASRHRSDGGLVSIHNSSQEYKGTQSWFLL